MHEIMEYQRYNFCFFSKLGGVSKNDFFSLNCAYSKGDNDQNVKKNRQIACHGFSQTKIIIPNQNHTNTVLEVKKENNIKLNSDGLISNRGDILLGILTADCAPIVILGKKQFAIVHAGWKGLIDGIIENTIDKLLRCGEFIENLAVFVGPHLKKKSFEVKEDFIEILKKKVNYFDNFIEKSNKCFFFDFSKLIEEKLKENKINNFQISDEDTFSNPEKFFSHRYSTINKIKKCGRQISLVGIKNKDI